MAQPMFGVESEYAIAGINGGAPWQHDDLADRLVRAARRRLKYLPDMFAAAGMYLENGARFYIDCGFHPEMTTPECTTPWELARYVKAGERILEGLAREVQSEIGGGMEVACFRCNVDYSGTESTWGCHESYLHRADPAGLPDQIIPHLVTRAIYTGAGGFNPLVNWPEFSVAPRLMHIENSISGDSTGNRGIFHTKNETLATRGYNRLHVLCGESLCSETALVLKIGATALVVAMAEEGLKPGAGLKLAEPIDALRAVASDAACRTRLRLAEGGEKTALELQRRLLDMAERNRSALPPWADAVCALWRRTLDQLDGAPDSVATVLDWAIKRRLFSARAERRGIPIERFAPLTAIIQRLNLALARVNIKSRGVRLGTLLAPGGPIPDAVKGCAQSLAEDGLGWDDLDHFLTLRDELYQIDTRFGQLGPRGIFTELDRQGVLDHKVDGIGDVEAAMSEPPAAGRAKLRGEAVRRLAGQREALCGWMSVLGPDRRKLDLSDPFTSAEVWSAPPTGEAAENPQLVPPVDFASDDSSHFQQVLAAMRERHARLRARAQGPAETT